MEYHTESRPAALLVRLLGIKAEKAERIVRDFPRGSMSRASAAELRGSGCTKLQADTIVAAFELARGAVAGDAPWQPILGDPTEAADFLRSKYGDLEAEHFIIVMLDSRQRVMETRTVAQGTVSSVDVHPRELFRPAIRAGAHSVLLCHNHPSGNCEPSEADVELTNRMLEAGRLVGIPVIDHLIVTRTDHSSLAALGLMERP